MSRVFAAVRPCLGAIATTFDATDFEEDVAAY